MLSIRAAEEVVLPMLPEGCSIAANNGPQLCVASGPDDAIAALQQLLEKDGVQCKALHTSHAFHSPMMDPIVAPTGRWWKAWNAMRRAFRSSAPSPRNGSPMRRPSRPNTGAATCAPRCALHRPFSSLWNNEELTGDRVMLEVGHAPPPPPWHASRAPIRKRQVAVPSPAITQAMGSNWYSC